MAVNNPFKILLDEHEVIRLVENIIKSIDKSWKEDENKYADTIKQLLVFFKEYSDNFHHYKEEDVLFRELKNKPDFLAQDIISELELHHKEFRATVLEIKEALEKRDWAHTQTLLTRYFNDLLDHIAVENDEFFVMAESAFSKDELDRMYFKFEDIDLELGKLRKEELVNRLVCLDNELK